MKKLISIVLIAFLFSCETIQNLPASCETCFEDVLPIIIDSLQNDIEFQVLNADTQRQRLSETGTAPRTEAILHVIALNARVNIKSHKFIMVLPENYLSDTSFAGQLTRQLKFMNLQGSNGSVYPSLQGTPEYPSTLYPHDTIFWNRQGKICELWVAQTQAQIDMGSKEWIQRTLDTNYGKYRLRMENSRGLKLVYYNQ